MQQANTLQFGFISSAVAKCFMHAMADACYSCVRRCVRTSPYARVGGRRAESRPRRARRDKQGTTIGASERLERHRKKYPAEVRQTENSE
ncbi:unnamed protein product [Anisakis simplex]|uniref:Secreted protein n=1 Tax=Anisakis simplex TaxID=6269 RepID=A0A0M3JWU3_ANISI|nr:unnamed protein product [Anisakis simplex]